MMGQIYLMACLENNRSFKMKLDPETSPKDLTWPKDLIESPQTQELAIPITHRLSFLRIGLGYHQLR